MPRSVRRTSKDFRKRLISIALGVSPSILPPEVCQALRDFRERLHDIESAAQDSPLSANARDIVWYLDALDEMGRVKYEDQTVQKQIEKPGLNPLNHWWKEEMRDQRAIKATRLRGIQQEITRKAENIKDALENFGANNGLVPTQELATAEALLGVTVAPSLLNDSEWPDRLNIKVQEPDVKVNKAKEPSRSAGAAVEDNDFVGADRKGCAEELATEADVVFAIAIAKEQASAPDHWVTKLLSPPRGSPPKAQNVVFVIWIKATKDENRNFRNFSAFADQHEVRLPEKYGDLRIRFTTKVATDGQVAPPWTKACKIKDPELRRWFADAQKYAKKQGMYSGRLLSW